MLWVSFLANKYLLSDQNKNPAYRKYCFNLSTLAPNKKPATAGFSKPVQMEQFTLLLPIYSHASGHALINGVYAPEYFAG